MAVSDANISAGSSGASITPPSASWNVSPTSFLFGALLFAFLFYITINGDLAKWLGLLGLGAQPLAPAQNPAAVPAVTTATGAINPASALTNTTLTPTSFVQGSQFT